MEEVVYELYPHKQATLRITLDSSLDRDLGLDSLARMELLMRIERSLNVRLPERTLASAETPRDLLRASVAAGPEHHRELTQVSLTPATDEVEAIPERARTLTEVLRWHVAAHPQRTHVLLYDEQEDTEKLSYHALLLGAERIAQGLVAKGLLAGESVAIMLPTGADYLCSFMGVLMAGGIPVPIYPPVRMSQVEDHIRRHALILSNALAKVMITFDQVKAVARLLQSQVSGLRHVVTVADLKEPGDTAALPVNRANDVAFLQYTSGSTGNPKGVVLTHANLLANIRAMGATINASPHDVFVSWLPLYHDMGLIGAWFGSMYFGFSLVLMSPLTFLSRPARWLRAIHQHRGTLSAGPNFAYELCLKRIEDKDIEGLDLSSWRMAFNGAEPVSAHTLRRFVERFSKFGLRDEAIAPVYGLAEVSLGIGFPPPGRGPRIDRIKRERLQREGRAQPAAEDDVDAIEVVGCGQPLSGYQVRVIDDTGHELGEREQGHLQFMGPSTTSGYFRNAEETRRLFDGDWLNSGDLAYIAGGEIFITGRDKDVIIRAGRNVYPYQLESAIGELEGIRQGCVAVFGSADPNTQTERLIVVAETREQSPTIRETLVERVRDLSRQVLDLPPDDIVLAGPHTVLKTSSGKIRRVATRDLYERGRLSSTERHVWLQFVRLALAAVVPRARGAWRALGTWLYAGYTWTVAMLVAVPAWFLIVVSAKRSWSWLVAKYAVRIVLRLAGIKLHTRGMAHIPSHGSYVLVSNHASYLDGAVLVAIWPHPVAFVAKIELSGNVVTRWLLQRLGVHFIERFDAERSVDDAQRIMRAIHDGAPLGYFPEGTFRRMPGLLPFQLGAFVTAVEAKTPVLPVTLRGTRSVLRGNHLFPRRGTIYVDVAQPVAGEPADALPDSGWQTAIALRDRVRAVMLKSCGEPDLLDERPLADLR